MAEKSSWHDKMGNYKKEDPEARRSYYRGLLLQKVKNLRKGLTDKVDDFSYSKGDALRAGLKLAKLEGLKTSEFKIKVKKDLLLSEILSRFAGVNMSKRSGFDSSVMLANLSGQDNKIDGKLFNIDELHVGETVLIKDNILTILGKDGVTKRVEVKLFPDNELPEEGDGHDAGHFTEIPPVETPHLQRIDILTADQAEARVLKILQARLPRFREKIDEAKGWAKDIVDTMKEVQLPLTKQNLVLVALTIERESDFHEIPLINDPEKILERAFKEYRSKWPALFSAVEYVYPLDNVQAEALEYIRTVKAGNLANGQFTIGEGGRKEGVFTERDLHNAIDQVVAKINASFALSHIPGLKEKIESFRPKTCGAMQLDMGKAVKLAEKYDHQRLTANEARDRLGERKAGLHYGVLNLKEIIDAHKDAQGEVPDSKVNFVFVDYNMGIHTTRNAALQDGINRWIKQYAGGHDLLDMDGDMLSYNKEDQSPKGEVSKTEQAIRDIFGTNNVANISNEQIRNDLKSEKSPDFVTTKTYRALKEIFLLSRVECRQDLIPEIRTAGSGVKFGQAISAQGYARGSRSRYDNMMGV